LVILRKRSAGTVITSGELVPVILLLKGLANAKLAAAKITKTIKHRAAKIFMFEEIHAVFALANWNRFTRLQRHLNCERSVKIVRLCGWSLGVSALDSRGRTIRIADAHHDDGKRFVVHAEELWTAFEN
jgi:hypothetical protein